MLEMSSSRSETSSLVNAQNAPLDGAGQVALALLPVDFTEPRDISAALVCAVSGFGRSAAHPRS